MSPYITIKYINVQPVFFNNVEIMYMFNKKTVINSNGLLPLNQVR